MCVRIWNFSPCNPVCFLQSTPSTHWSAAIKSVSLWLAISVQCSSRHINENLGLLTIKGPQDKQCQEILANSRAVIFSLDKKVVDPPSACHTVCFSSARNGPNLLRVLMSDIAEMGEESTSPQTCPSRISRSNVPKCREEKTFSDEIS